MADLRHTAQRPEASTADATYFKAISIDLEEAFAAATTALVKAKPTDTMQFLSEHFGAIMGAPGNDAKDLRTVAAASVPHAEEDTTGEWTIAAWMKSLPLDGLVADAMGPPAPAGEAQLEHAKSLDFETARRLLRTADIEVKLAQAVAEASAVLRKQGAMTATALNAKFANEASFELAVGNLDVFYGGLERLVGPPRMIDGSLHGGMEVEHCKAIDSDVEFKSSNGLTSTSRVEWEFVVSPAPEKVYPEREGFREAHPDKARKPGPLSEYLTRMEEKNGLLVAAGHTPLIKEEVVGGRLYTGPMYEKYNLVLRSKSGNPFLVSRFDQLCQGNHYATCLHSINSCIIKLSKLMKAQRIYRGLTRAKLPREFLHANDFGIKGGIEYGFTSTTVERAQAMHYAQGVASTVFEMDMGMIDRGADVSWLSQYEHEREVLFSPLMGIEVKEVRVDGGTLSVEARLSLNLTSLTLEQVVAKRKKLIEDMAAQMAAEVRKDCEASTADAAESTVQEKLTTLLAETPEFFNADVQFQHAVRTALKVKRSVELAANMTTTGEDLAASMLQVEPLQDNVVDLTAWELGDGGAHVAVVQKWMGSNPAGLTKLTIDVPKACADVVKALHVLVAATSTLVELDVKKGRSLNILQLNGTERIESLDLSGRNYGPRSAAIVAVCLLRNTSLKKLNLDGFELNIEQLKGVDPVESLHLSHHYNYLGLASAIVIAKCIELNTTITNLDLSDNQLCGIDEDGEGTYDPSGIQALAAAIGSGSTAITDLNLAGNNLCGIDILGNGTYTTEGINAICEALKVKSALKKIVLSEHQIKDKGAISIAGSLKTNSTLENLELKFCGIGPAGGAAIAKSLQSGISTLKSLSLVDNQLCGVDSWGRGTYDPSGVQAIAAALTGSSTALTECTLINNNLDVDSATILAKIGTEKRIMLSGMKRDQTEANFFGQGLSAADGILIASDLPFISAMYTITLDGHGNGFPLPVKQLKGTEPVETLDLYNKGLRSLSAIVIGKLIEFNNTLKSVDLSNNNLTNYGCDMSGIQALADALKLGSTSITDLNLGGNNIGSAGAKAIAEALQFGTTSLKSLSLADNQLCGIINKYGDGTYDPSGIQAIAAALTGSSGLTVIDLQLNYLDDDTKRALTAAAKQRCAAPLDLKL